VKKAILATSLGLAAAITLSAASAKAALTAIDACEEISLLGSYILQQNLTATGDCMIINVSQVSINLNGFSITGPGGTASGTVGISTASGVEFTIVIDGFVSNFATCVSLETDGTAVVQAVKMSGCVNDLVAGGIMSDSVVLGAYSGVGMQVSGVISGNNLINSHYGMLLGYGRDVFHNTLNINGASGYGIFANCPVNIVNNTIVDCDSYHGIVFYGGGCNASNDEVGIRLWVLQQGNVRELCVAAVVQPNPVSLALLGSRRRATWGHSRCGTPTTLHPPHRATGVKHMFDDVTLYQQQAARIEDDPVLELARQLKAGIAAEQRNREAVRKIEAEYEAKYSKDAMLAIARAASDYDNAILDLDLGEEETMALFQVYLERGRYRRALWAAEEALLSTSATSAAGLMTQLVQLRKRVKEDRGEIDEQMCDVILTGLSRIAGRGWHV
jgi:hypothetical protein